MEKIKNGTEIHITTDSVKVYAVLKEGGKITKWAEAKCYPSDTFDFEKGAKIAFNRLVKDKKKTRCTDFKDGERVRFRSWEDMVKEFGVSLSGDILCPHVFSERMKYLCGSYAIINEIKGEKVSLKIAENGYTPPFFISTDMIEKVSGDDNDDTEKIEVGDRVEVIDNKKSYTTFSSWFDRLAPELAVFYSYGITVPNGEKGVVKKISPHGLLDRNLYAFQVASGNIFLIEASGLKKI